MALRTPLYSCHVELRARMVDFAGWDMPVQYSSIVEEHRAVRTGVGIFDISHMGRLWFSGPDSMTLVQRLYTNNASTLKEGQARYGLVCNERGGIKDDVLIYRLQGRLGMVVNASNRIKILGWIKEHQPRTGVEVVDRTQESCMIAVQGPGALRCCQRFITADLASLHYYFALSTTYQGNECIVSRTGYTGEDGFEFIVKADEGPRLWKELCADGAKPCGLGARDTLRLEAAMPLYGHELTEEIDPFEAGLDWAVKLDKGDFVGRQALLARHEAGPAKVRVGLELEGKRVAREGSGVFRHEAQVGEVTSGTFSPTLNRPIAMAYISKNFNERGLGCTVDIRGKSSAARIVPLPFYKRQQRP
jgi:aminomethyltransferase